MLRIDHETRLSYSEPVIESVIEVRMTPPSNEDQTVLGHKIRIVPAASVTPFRDGFGNRAELFSVVPPHAEVLIHASSCVRGHRRDPQVLLAAQPFPPAGVLPIEAAEYLRPSPLIIPEERLRAFVAGLPPLPSRLAEAIPQLLEIVRGKLKYAKETTDSETAVAKALETGSGVCQDFAHLFIAVCRQLGLPARYVSGYIHEPGELATHAWAQFWAGPTATWVDVDPTRGIFAGNEHVLTAVGRDFSDVPPNKGVWKGAGATEKISVSVSVKPVDKVPSELTELAAPAWSSTSQEQNQNGRAFFQQQKRIVYRQQQSQQQQL